MCSVLVQNNVFMDRVQFYPFIFYPFILPWVTYQWSNIFWIISFLFCEFGTTYCISFSNTPHTLEAYIPSVGRRVIESFYDTFFVMTVLPITSLLLFITLAPDTFCMVFSKNLICLSGLCEDYWLFFLEYLAFNLLKIKGVL